MTRWLILAAVLAAFGVGPTAAQAPDLQARAAAGEPQAQLDLSRLLREGIGRPRNHAQARQWARRAAQSGLAEAARDYGQYLFAGVGGPKDIDAGLALLARGAASGAPEALHDLATALQTARPDQAARVADLFQRAVDAGHVPSMTSLGVLYQNGVGVAADPERAETLYRRAIEAGDTRAMNNLGTIITRRATSEPEKIEARALFERAAARGLRPAMQNLSVMLENGFGGPVDEPRAIELSRAASNAGLAAVDQPLDSRLLPPDMSQDGLTALLSLADAGDPVAQYQIGWLFLTGRIQPDDPSRVMALLHRAAKSGLVPAMALLGQALFDGRGVPQDFVAGNMWRLLAEAAGGTSPPVPIPERAASMTPDQIAQSQSLAADLWDAIAR